MATTIKELIVGLGIKVDERKMSRFQRRLGTVGNRMKRVGALAKTATKAVAGLAAAAAGIGFAVFKLADSVSKAGDQFAKQAKQIGTTAETLQEYAFAAQRSGASGDQLVKAMGRMSKAIEDVRIRGTGPLADQLKILGISIEEFEGLKPEEAFDRLADIISNVEDPLKRAAIAQDAFGRSGKELIPLLMEGSEGIRGLREEARKYGGVISDEAAAQSEVLQDRITDLKFTLTGLKNTIGVALIPIVTKYVERIRDWILSNRGLVAQRVPEILEKIVQFMRELAPALLKIVKGFAGLIDMVGGIDKLVLALGALKLATLALTNPWVAVAAAAAAAGIAIGKMIVGTENDLTRLQDSIRQTRSELRQLQAENRETRAFLEETGTAAEERRTTAQTQAEGRARAEARRRAAGLGKKLADQVAIEAARLVRERGVSPGLAVDLAIRSAERGEIARVPRRGGQRRAPTRPIDRDAAPGQKGMGPARATDGGGELGEFAAREPRTLQELIEAPAGGMLGEERQRAPVSITVVNNNFDVDAPISITGIPGEDRESIATRVKDGLRDVLAEAAQNLQPARVR